MTHSEGFGSLVDQPSIQAPMVFEKLVGAMLIRLAAAHIPRVSVVAQPRLRLQNGQEVVPDFELICDLPYQRDRRLIECQDRKRFDQDLTQRIRHIKSLSNRNRFIFVYPCKRDLPEAVIETLTGDGILHYDLTEFALFLDHLSVSLVKLEELDRQELASGGPLLAQARYWLHLREQYVAYLAKELDRMSNSPAPTLGIKLAEDLWKKDASTEDRGWHRDEGMLGSTDPNRSWNR